MWASLAGHGMVQLPKSRPRNPHPHFLPFFTNKATLWLQASPVTLSSSDVSSMMKPISVSLRQDLEALTRQQVHRVNLPHKRSILATFARPSPAIIDDGAYSTTTSRIRRVTSHQPSGKSLRMLDFDDQCQLAKAVSMLIRQCREHVAHGHHQHAESSTIYSILISSERSLELGGNSFHCTRRPAWKKQDESRYHDAPLWLHRLHTTSPDGRRRRQPAVSGQL